MPKYDSDSRREHESQGHFRCIEDAKPYRRANAAIDGVPTPVLSPFQPPTFAVRHYDFEHGDDNRGGEGRFSASLIDRQICYPSTFPVALASANAPVVPRRLPSPWVVYQEKSDEADVISFYCKRMTPALELLTAWYPKAWRDPLTFPLHKSSSRIAGALTVEEAARYLAVSPETVRRLCRKREIPFAKIGSDYRFLQVDLDALFVQNDKKISREESLKLLK